MAQVPSVELFNNSTHQKLRESWCAGMFGIGYSRFIAPCAVAVNESDVRLDADFFVQTVESEYSFQLAEVQEPGRRRGREYKEFEHGVARSVAYDVERGRVEGPEWLSQAAARKKSKRYQASGNLHLLLYANFATRELQYTDIFEALIPFRDTFASLWVVTGLNLCCIFAPVSMGGIEGWVVVRSVEDYYK